MKRFPLAVMLVPASLSVHLLLAACGGDERSSHAGVGGSGGSGGGGEPAQTTGGGECFCQAPAEPTVYEVPCEEGTDGAPVAALSLPGRTISELARVSVVAQRVQPLTYGGHMYGYEVPRLLIDDGRVAVHCIVPPVGTPAYGTIRFVVPAP